MFAASLMKHHPRKLKNSIFIALRNTDPFFLKIRNDEDDDDDDDDDGGGGDDDADADGDNSPSPPIPIFFGDGFPRTQPFFSQKLEVFVPAEA